jgi:multidrug efflux system membrane fusion protein
VQRATQGTIVYVVGDDNTVTVRAVKLGPTEGDITGIDSGLKAGEKVVTDGVDRIREGARVEVVVPGQPSKGGADAAAKREALKKKMEGMTPEQREAFKKQREAAKNGGS